MECTDAGRLIASYLDGELSEAQAAPLRKHLLACQPCRGEAQGEKNLKRWFVATEPVAVPRDFAARVARRAFAGDRGERFTPVLAARPAEDRTLRFVLQVTAIAASLLVIAAIALSSLKLPSGNRLAADTKQELSLDQALQELDRLEHASAKPQPKVPAADAKSNTQLPSSSASPSQSSSNGGAQK